MFYIPIRGADIQQTSLIMFERNTPSIFEPEQFNRMVQSEFTVIRVDTLTILVNIMGE